MIRALLFSCWFIWVLALPAIADTKKIVIVTNDPSVERLSKQQIKHIYMNGMSHNLNPIHLTQGNKTRIIFNSTIIGLTESRINSYWIQMKFSGKADPPLEVDSFEEVFKQLHKDLSSIAYLPHGIDIPSTLRVIYTLEY